MRTKRAKPPEDRKHPSNGFLLLVSSIADDVAHDTKKGSIARAQEGIDSSFAFAFAFTFAFAFAYLRTVLRTYIPTHGTAYVGSGEWIYYIGDQDEWTLSEYPKYIIANIKHMSLYKYIYIYIIIYTVGIAHLVGYITKDTC